MTRRTDQFTVTKALIGQKENRDFGKIYLLTEMSAWAAEKWAARALLAIMKSADLPEDFASAGLSGVAALGMKAFGGIMPDALLPLMDEMLACVQVIPDPKHPMPRGLVEEDIEEINTLFEIRKRLLDLHLGFSLAAKLSAFSASAATILSSKNMSTSQQSSE
jgi:hypothetical protein